MRHFVKSASWLAGVLALGVWEAQSGFAAPPRLQPEKRPAAAAEVEPIVHHPQTAEINRQIEAHWAPNDLRPSARASDHEFIRRVTLDIIGRIATPAEIAQFLADPPQSRRELLIDRLLDNGDYAENWAALWTVWLMSRSGSRLHHEQLQLWLQEQFAMKDTRGRSRGWDRIVGDLLTATGDNNDNGAVNFILSHLGEPTPEPRIAEEGMFQFVPLTARTTRLFLGVQIQCAQCHCHPFNPAWQQKHFWGLNAFFRQVVREGNPVQANDAQPIPKLALKDNPRLNATATVFYESRYAVVAATRPVFLDGTKLDPRNPLRRREQLAQLVLGHDLFAKAFVNRLWFHFFGRGMTANGTDFDDLGVHNTETHPELLDFLAREFKGPAVAHDPRMLIRWICNSRAYSLSCVANDTNDRPDAEPFYSRMLLKALSPEQLFHSLWISTYARQPLVAAEKKKLREEWLRQLVVNFGDDEGNESTFNGTVVQALLLMNGDKINSAIADKNGPVQRALRKGALTTAIDELFMTALNRPPTVAEVRSIRGDIEPVLLKGQPRDKVHWEKVGQDIFWALLNSSEFLLNH